MESTPSPVQDNKKRNITIAVVAAVVVLCCCCPVVLYGLNWLWTNGDNLLGSFSRALPVLFGV